MLVFACKYKYFKLDTGHNIARLFFLNCKCHLIFNYLATKLNLESQLVFTSLFDLYQIFVKFPSSCEYIQAKSL